MCQSKLVCLVCVQHCCMESMYWCALVCVLRVIISCIKWELDLPFLSRTAYDFETGEYTTTVVEVTTTSYVCCEGWSGDDCDVPPGTNPCGKLTCEEDPRARCALIKRCGIEIPLFVNDMGRVIKNCLPEEHLCTGICKTDPCNGLSCEHYPEAMCFTSGCSCEPVWLLPSKVRVSDCSIDPATKRNVRQVPKQCQSWMGFTVLSPLHTLYIIERERDCLF